MNKVELIAAVAEKNNISKKEAEVAVTIMFDSIIEALKNGDKVAIAGFGSFEVKARAARAGINPKTKEAITIAASKAPVFKAGKAFKDAIQ